MENCPRLKIYEKKICNGLRSHKICIIQHHIYSTNLLNLLKVPTVICLAEHTSFSIKVCSVSCSVIYCLDCARKKRKHSISGFFSPVLNSKRLADSGSIKQHYYEATEENLNLRKTY